MLVLSRKPGEKIHIGAQITITVTEVKGNRVRVGIDAPGQVAIVRGELQDSLDDPFSEDALRKLPAECRP
jgi:carbon storage regulator